MSRRTLLRSSAVAGAGVFVPSIGASSNGKGGNPADDTAKAARTVLENTGDQDLFERTLKKSGYDVASETIEYSIPATRSDGVSTQALNKANCEITMTFAKIADKEDVVQVFANWEHEVNYDIWHNESGEKPDDIAGFGYAEDDYVLEEWWSDSYSSRDEYSADGIAFKYCDSCCGLYEEATGTCAPEGETFTIDGYCQVHLSEKSDGPKDHVYFDYHHLFEQVGVSGISISNSGISVTVSEEERRWHKDARIHEDDAI